MLINQANNIVKVNAQDFNVKYDHVHNEFIGKDANRFALLRSRLRECYHQPHKGAAGFSLGERAALKQ